jgi:PAS domain S-box-containing protein
VALALGVLFWLRSRFYRPLADIERGMARVSRGDYSAPVRVYRLDEIGKLAELVNQATGSVRLRSQAQERQTRDLSERVGRLLDDSMNEIYMFDAEHLELVQINGTARRNLQWEMDESFAGVTPLDFVANLEEGKFRADLRSLSESDRTHLYVEGRNRRKDGSEYPFEGALQYSATEDPPVYLAIVRDVTEEREREEKLRQAQKLEAIGQLTGGVAHDFNNLLTVIIGGLELLRDAVSDDREATELVDEATKAADRGAALTHQLLAYSRKQPLRPEDVDVNRLLSDMDGLLRRTLGETLDIELVIAAGLWSCEVDPTQLQNVLLNLAINARDAMIGGGKLTIETANTRLDEDYAEEFVDVEPGQYVMIAITDTGEGMSAEMCERVFEPFFTTKETGKGSGLGLSMVYGFVKQSAGHIKIYSEPGQGTTVRMYIPRLVARDESDTMKRAKLSPADVPLGRGETILVVEDDVAVRQLAAHLLETLGYRIEVAGDVAEALALLDSPRGRSFDLLFTDVVLPGGKSGHDLAKEALSRHPSLGVLFTSGYTQNAIVHEGRLDKGVELVEKPYSREQLAVRIRATLDKVDVPTGS